MRHEFDGLCITRMVTGHRAGLRRWPPFTPLATSLLVGRVCLGSGLDGSLPFGSLDMVSAAAPQYRSALGPIKPCVYLIDQWHWGIDFPLFLLVLGGEAASARKAVSDSASICCEHVGCGAS